MSTFAFRAIDVAGTPSRGELEAASKGQVTEQLRQRGLIVLDVSEKHDSIKVEGLFERFQSVSMRNLSVFSRQFATLIASGMPMLRSLYTLEDQTEDEKITAAIVDLRRDVEAGSSVADSMERNPAIFDPLYRSMVRAGEGSGRLEQALDMVAVQLEKLDALRRQVRSAMMYPMLVFGFAVIVMSVVVAFIVPVFTGIFEELSQDSGEPAELPFMTQITVTISDLLTGAWFILFPGIALAFFLFFQWKKTERGHYQWDALKLKLPAKVGDVVQKVAIARWSRVFSGTEARASASLPEIRPWRTSWARWASIVCIPVAPEVWIAE